MLEHVEQPSWGWDSRLGQGGRNQNQTGIPLSPKRKHTFQTAWVPHTGRAQLTPAPCLNPQGEGTGATPGQRLWGHPSSPSRQARGGAPSDHTHTTCRPHSQGNTTEPLRSSPRHPQEGTSPGQLPNKEQSQGIRRQWPQPGPDHTGAGLHQHQADGNPTWSRENTWWLCCCLPRLQAAPGTLPERCRGKGSSSGTAHPPCPAHTAENCSQCSWDGLGSGCGGDTGSAAVSPSSERQDCEMAKQGAHQPCQIYLKGRDRDRPSRVTARCPAGSWELNAGLPRGGRDPAT